jgi:hypothetical protein
MSNEFMALKLEQKGPKYINDYLLITKEELSQLKKDWAEFRPDENIYKAGILKCLDTLINNVGKQEIHAFDKKETANGVEVFVGYNSIVNNNFHFIQIPLEDEL